MLRRLVRKLNLSTIFAYQKSLADSFFTGNEQFLTTEILLTEIDFPHGRLLYKLIAERNLPINHTVCRIDIFIVVNLHQHFLMIKLCGAVIAVIAVDAFLIFHVGIYHLHLQHRAHLSGIPPSRASALIAGAMGPAGAFKLRMGTGRAQPPSLYLCGIDIHLIDIQFLAPCVKAVQRSEFADGRGC